MMFMSLFLVWLLVGGGGSGGVFFSGSWFINVGFCLNSIVGLLVGIDVIGFWLVVVSGIGVVGLVSMGLMGLDDFVVEFFLLLLLLLLLYMVGCSFCVGILVLDDVLLVV